MKHYILVKSIRPRSKEAALKRLKGHRSVGSEMMFSRAERLEAMDAAMKRDRNKLTDRNA